MSVTVGEAWRDATQRKANAEAAIEPIAQKAVEIRQRANQKPYKGWDLWRTISERLSHWHFRISARRLERRLNDRRADIEYRFTSTANNLVKSVAENIPEMEELHARMWPLQSQRTSITEMVKILHRIESACGSSVERILLYGDSGYKKSEVRSHVSRSVVTVEENVVSLAAAIFRFERDFPSSDKLTPVPVRAIGEDVYCSLITKFSAADLYIKPPLEHLRPQLQRLGEAKHQTAAFIAELNDQCDRLKEVIERLAEEKRALIKTTLEKESESSPVCTEIVHYVIRMPRIYLSA